MQPDVRKILVVDDSALILSILKDTLELLPSVSVTALDNAREAIALAGEGDYALVLLDVEMPGMTGLEALDELARRGFDVRNVVLCSGDRSPELEKTLGERQIEFLQKPVELQTLFLLLKQRWGVEPPAARAVPGDRFPVTAEVLENFSGNVELYKRSLSRFLDEYRRWLDATTLEHEFPDLKDLRFFLHTLKGISAYLGAADLVQQVGSLQQAIRQETPRADLLLKESRLLASLQGYLRRLSSHFSDQARPEAPNAGDPRRTREHLERCLRLIEAHDAEAVDAVRQLSPESLPAPLRTDFRDLARLVLDYEFDSALTILKNLLDALGEQP